MLTALLGGLGSMGLSFGMDQLSNALNSKRSYNYNLKLQKQNQEWQEHMSSTSHQREVEDLRRAGLNPVLSANSGASYGAASGGGVSGGSNSGSDLLKSMGDVLSLQQKMADIDNTKANTEKAKAEKDNTVANTDLTKENITFQQGKNKQFTNTPGMYDNNIVSGTLKRMFGVGKDIYDYSKDFFKPINSNGGQSPASVFNPGPKSGSDSSKAAQIEFLRSAGFNLF